LLTSASSAASDILVQTAGPSGGNNGLTAVPSGENNGITATVSCGEQTPIVSRNICDALSPENGANKQEPVSPLGGV
jgi:hypothetical protein